MNSKSIILAGLILGISLTAECQLIGVRQSVIKSPTHCLTLSFTNRQWSNRETLVAEAFMNALELSANTKNLGRILVNKPDSLCPAESQRAGFLMSISDLNDYMVLELSEKNAAPPTTRRFILHPDSLAREVSKIAAHLAGGLTANWSNVTPRKKSTVKIQSSYSSGMAEYRDLLDGFVHYYLDKNGVPTVQDVERTDLTLQLNVSDSLTSGDQSSVTLFIVDPKLQFTIFASTRSGAKTDLLSMLEIMLKDCAVFFDDYAGTRAQISSMTASEITDLVPNDSLEEERIDYYMALLKRAVYLDSTFAPAYAKMGRIYFLKGDLGRSVDVLGKAVKNSARGAEYQYLLARSLSANNRDDEALHALKSALELVKSKDKMLTAKILVLIGSIHETRREFDAAIRHFEDACKKNENNKEIWWRLGNAHYKKFASRRRAPGDSAAIATAVQINDKAFRTFKDLTFARNAAYIFNYWGEELFFASKEPGYDSQAVDLLAIAKSKFNRALAYPHNDNTVRAMSFNYLAVIAVKIQDNSEDAFRYSAEAYKLKPSDEWTYRLFAILRKDSMNLLEPAKRAIKTAIAIDPSQVESYNIYGHLLESSGQQDSAFYIYSRIFELGGPGHSLLIPKFLQPYIRAAKNTGRYATAKEQIGKFLETSPGLADSLWALNQLAGVLSREKRYGQSLDVVKAILNIDSSHGEALEILDALILETGYAPALQFGISVFEQNLKSDSTVYSTWQLAIYYIKSKQTERAHRIADSALEKYADRDDQYNLLTLKAIIYHDYCTNDFMQNNTQRLALNTQQCIEFAQRAFNMKPERDHPLSFILSVYHDFLFDFQKAHEISQQILKLDSMEIKNIMNYIETAFTSKKYHVSLRYSNALIESRLKSETSVSDAHFIQALFYSTASYFAVSRITEGQIQLGIFIASYWAIAEVKPGTNLWHGLTRFMANGENDFRGHKEILTEVLSVVKAQTKAEGLAIVNDLKSRILIKQ